MTAPQTAPLAGVAGTFASGLTLGEAPGAASLGRLAASLCHELNSPLGALTSAVETLFLLAARPASTPGSERVQAELRGSVSVATVRLREIIACVQRLAHLDSEHLQAADLNKLLGEAAARLEPGEVRERIRLDLRPLPLMVCRPHQWIAVFPSLLGSAVASLQEGGRLLVSTCWRQGQIEIALAGDGQGRTATEWAAALDPGFSVWGARVSTGDWGLLAGRQVIQDHRGRIRIDGSAGRAAAILITLPCGPITGSGAADGPGACVNTGTDRSWPLADARGSVESASYRAATPQGADFCHGLKQGLPKKEGTK